MKTSLGTRGAARSRAGFSLVELSVGGALLAGLLSAVLYCFVVTSRAYEDARAREDLSRRAHRVLDNVATELAEAGRAGLFPEPDPLLGSPTLAYRRSTGFDGEELLFGPPSRLEWQLAEGELDDGEDNNGNGLIDEGALVQVQDAGLATERTAVWSRWVRALLQGEVPNGLDDNANGLVDEPGLVFTLEGDVLTIRLSLERIGPRGVLMTKTVETAVRIRN